MKNPKAYQSYFGGKEAAGTYQTLINLIPPHRLYCSLFLGNDAVYRKMKPAKFALLNDIDAEVINAWLSAGYGSSDIVCFDDDDGLAILAALVADFEAAVSSVFMPVTISKSDTFLFLDPPYLLDSRKSNRPVYRNEMTDAQHSHLLRYVTDPVLADVKIMLCCYQNDLYSRWLDSHPGWHYLDFQSTTRNGLAWERVYMNYPPPTELHDYRYFGGNFRQREQFKRICASLVKKIEKVPAGLRPTIIADIVTSLQNVKDENVPNR